MYSRRHFLKLAGLLGVIPLALRAQAKVTNVDDGVKDDDNDQKAREIIFPVDRMAVVQGATDATSTLLSVLVHKDTQPQIKVMDMYFQTLHFDIERKDFGVGGDFVIYQIFVEGLNLGEEYALTVSDSHYPELYIRYFKALDLKRTDVNIAVMSCANHRDADPKTTMFRKLTRSNPDVIFFIGDLVYGNSSLDTYLGRPATPENAYKIYVKSLLEFELYQQKNLIPMFTTWDDHDLAYNNCGADHPYKDFYVDLFRSFFPADARVKALTQGPGISMVFEAFGFQVIFSDARYFKDKKKQEFLGEDQFKWLFEQMEKSSLPKMIILSQQLLYYSYIAESYERNALKEFNAFISQLRKLAQPVLFISGDVHYSQIQILTESLLGYKTFEITSSAFFSGSAGNIAKRKESDGQIAYYGYPNFVTLNQIKTSSESIEVAVNCVSQYSDTQFSKNLKIEL